MAGRAPVPPEHATPLTTYDEIRGPPPSSPSTCRTSYTAGERHARGAEYPANIVNLSKRPNRQIDRARSGARLRATSTQPVGRLCFAYILFNS
jgi:hypothetical protein